MFVGREKELTQLKLLLDSNHANLVVIKGRRRVGKSRLIAEFAKSMRSYTFMGLSPRKGITSQDQRDEFVRQFREQFSLPFTTTLNKSDWGDLFTSLAKKCVRGRVIILFDEISWMATQDADFLGKLKIAWDMHFSKNSKLILILCGSVSIWIEKNILSSTGYLGRPSLHISLDELPLTDCNKFWKNKDDISSFEKLKILALTGGIPRYLELLNYKLSAEANIANLCFNKNSPLFDEFKNIFSDIYGKKSETYTQIVKYLVNSKASRDDIMNEVGILEGGDLSECLYNLETGGFIERDFTWLIKNCKISKLSHYRLRDNYTRFYLKYIYPNKAKIEKGQFENISINNLPGWNTILGLQFENLVLNNRIKILQSLSIPAEDVICASPYFQRKTSRQSGCQIDYMIQTKHDTIYICEIKFSRQMISKEIVTEIKEKISKLNLPKFISRRPILIHVNGVKEEVLDSDYFSKIIDFSSFLDE
ncbi:MAG: ATPase [Oligoflexia bacterium]|nr:ATPase [Oligoflexia bacterium]